MEAFAAIAAALVVVWAALVIVAHRLNPGQSPLSMGMSGLARGHAPWVMKSAFLCRGASALVLLIALPPVLGTAGLALAGILAFWIWGVGSAALAVLDTDMPGEPASRAGSAHTAVALLSYVCGSGAAAVLSASLMRTDATAVIGGWALPVALLALAAMVLQFVAFGAAAQQARAAGAGAGAAPWQAVSASAVAPPAGAAAAHEAAVSMPAPAADQTAAAAPAPPQLGVPPQLGASPRSASDRRPAPGPAAGALGASLQAAPGCPNRRGLTSSIDDLGRYAGLLQRVFIGLLMAWTLLVALGIVRA